MFGLSDDVTNTSDHNVWRQAMATVNNNNKLRQIDLIIDGLTANDHRNATYVHMYM